MIEIMDDGVGMNQDTLLHLLEPPEGGRKGYFCCTYGAWYLCGSSAAALPVWRRIWTCGRLSTGKGYLY